MAASTADNVISIHFVTPAENGQITTESTKRTILPGNNPLVAILFDSAEHARQFMESSEPNDHLAFSYGQEADRFVDITPLNGDFSLAVAYLNDRFQFAVEELLQNEIWNQRDIQVKIE